MAEGPSPDLSEAPLSINLDKSDTLSLAEQLSPVLEIKAVPLVPTTIRQQSGKDRRQSKRDSEPDKCLNDQSKATANSTAAQDFDVSRSKSPSSVESARTGKLVKRLSQATFPDEFPELASVKRKLSLCCLSTPLCNSPQKNAAPELLPGMQHAPELMPPLEYIHQCMPVSYHLKRSPVTIDQLSVLKIFEDLRIALSSRPVLQASRSGQSKRESANCCTRMQPLSSLESRPPTKIVPKTPRKPIPIANLSIKGIPKVRSYLAQLAIDSCTCLHKLYTYSVFSYICNYQFS